MNNTNMIADKRNALLQAGGLSAMLPAGVSGAAERASAFGFQSHAVARERLPLRTWAGGVDEQTVCPLDEVTCRHIVGTVIDVAAYKALVRELRASRENLRLLSVRQERMLEDERRRLSLELHDELGQLLTGIHMANSALQLVHGHDSFVAQQSGRISEMVDKAVGVVRQVATNLRPIALDMGLVASLSWLAKRHRQLSGTACEFHVCGQLPARNDRVDVAIFRVVQEALTNISRHASAAKVSIRLTPSADRISVVIEDDGIGFDPKKLASDKTLGLIGQRERLRGIGGAISIESAPGRGTTVTLTAPTQSNDDPPADR